MVTTTKLRAYHGDPAVKQKFIDRLAEHRRLEHLAQGVGWFNGDSGKSIKGCAVGCTLEEYNHWLYPVELGLPVWLAYLEDVIFEGLPRGEAEQFAEEFLRTIPVGADVWPVRHKLAIARIDLSLASLDGNQEPYADKCRAALQQVRAWHASELEGVQDESAQSAVQTAAWTAESAVTYSLARDPVVAWIVARSARMAVWSAAHSSDPRDQSAAESARSAAESARSAAAAVAASPEIQVFEDDAGESYIVAGAVASTHAARATHYQWEARNLLKLLATCQG